MARILFVAPSSFPLNGPEAYVNAKVIKTLSEAGHILDIVSLKSIRRDRYYPPEEDHKYFEKVNSINVVKINTGKNLSTLYNHLRCFFKTGFVYKGSDWAYKSIIKCEKLIKKNHYDYVYTYDYPSEIVGLYVAKKYDIKWIATWNDPYTMSKYPIPYGLGKDANLNRNRLKLISEIGKYTYKNVFPNERLKKYMLSYMSNMKEESCLICPHIVLKDQIKYKKREYSNTLRLIHSGSIGKERDPEYFFRALYEVKKHVKDIKVEVTFLGINTGKTNDNIKSLIKELDISDNIIFYPPIHYSDSLKFILDYDICLIIEAQCDEGIFLPSKVADYIQNSKPIFAISPKRGVLNDLWHNGNISYFADNKSIEDIEKTLIEIIEDFKNSKVTVNNKVQTYFSGEVSLKDQLEMLNCTSK